LAEEINVFGVVTNSIQCKRCANKGQNNPMYGKIWTEEQKLKKSEKMKGKNNYFYNKKFVGEKNSRWRGGKSRFKCKDCGKIIDFYATRCQSCAKKEYFKNPKNHPSYKHGLSKKGNKYIKYLCNQNLNFKIGLIIRYNMAAALKKNWKSGHTIDLLGCSIGWLREHLENQFKVGMTWDNHGLHGWHIDHIKPCASFDLSKPEEQKKCFNYKNLQPLWAKDNLRKSSKILC
jgi:hypothetical protein